MFSTTCMSRPPRGSTASGRALLARAEEFGRANGASRLDLSTAKTNVKAQSVYESLGWVRDEVFLQYSLPLT